MGLRPFLFILITSAVFGGLLGSVPVSEESRRPQSPTQVFEGIIYGRERLERTAEGSGLVHWARVDLTAPGIELYVTPLDPVAVAQGWEYRLRRIADVVDDEHLALAINGTLFTSNSNWLM